MTAEKALNVLKNDMLTYTWRVKHGASLIIVCALKIWPSFNYQNCREETVYALVGNLLEVVCWIDDSESLIFFST